MSEVIVPFGDSASDTATLLLAAAEELDLHPAVVRTQEGAFLVPEEVRDRAFGERADEEPEPTPVKKTAAKKSTRKKV